MKLYVVTDLEGVAGVYQWENRDDTSLENHQRRTRQRGFLGKGGRGGEVSLRRDA